ncbi:putative mitochondrial protein, partial [Mucuna pruriens]
MLSFFPNSPLMLSLPSHVFGCVVFVHSHNTHHGKLDLRAVKCVFIGYPSNKKGPPLHGESYLEVESIIESLYFPTQDVIESLPVPTQDVIESLPFPTQDVQEVIEPILVPKQVQLSESEVSILKNPIEDVTDDMPTALRKGKDHVSIREALKDVNWVQAMKDEMKVLEKNTTWEIIDRPKDKRAVGCKWIYNVKCESDGTLERYKARLVAKGHT